MAKQPLKVEYTSPQLQELFLHPQGCLCTSSDFDYNEDNTDLFSVDSELTNMVDLGPLSQFLF